MTVILGRPNSDFLGKLEPVLSADSILKLGNYQFSFYVDGRLIYQTNLWPGAPRATQQMTESTWIKPLINNQNEGAWWSQSAWGRFMSHGGDCVLTDGPHSFKLEIRDYIKTKTTVVKVSEVIASGNLILEVKRKPVLNLAAITLSSVNPYDGLEVSHEAYDQNKIKEMKGNIDADVFRHITSVVVLKNGRILIEEYFNGSTRDSLHDVRSVGKSFASTLIGMAIRDGYLKSVDQSLKEFYDLKSFDKYSVEKGNVTLRELLTMSSRFNGNDDDPNSPGNEENMYPTANWVKFVLDLPMDTVSYTGQWHYFTAGAMLLGSTLDKIIPRGLDRYANEKLFKPLNITRYKWQYTPQKVVSTAGGIQMKSLDFAKYGQLYKNGGLWNGKQVIPKVWVEESFTKQKAIPGRKDECYGYLFWNKKYHVKGKAYETFYCTGNGGNKIYVFKDQPLVVVVTATAYGAAYGHPQVDKMMEQYILPAILQ